MILKTFESIFFKIYFLKLITENIFYIKLKQHSEIAKLNQPTFQGINKQESKLSIYCDYQNKSNTDYQICFAITNAFIINISMYRRL